MNNPISLKYANTTSNTILFLNPRQSIGNIFKRIVISRRDYSRYIPSNIRNPLLHKVKSSHFNLSIDKKPTT